MATVEVQLATSAASLPENSSKEQPNDAQEAPKDEIEALPTSTPTQKIVQEKEESADVVKDTKIAQEFESKVEIKATKDHEAIEPEEVKIEKPIEKLKAAAAVVPVDEPEEVEVLEESPTAPKEVFEETNEKLEEKHQVEEASKEAPSEEKSDE